jgi:hypothetical protein
MAESNGGALSYQGGALPLSYGSVSNDLVAVDPDLFSAIPPSVPVPGADTAAPSSPAQPHSGAELRPYFQSDAMLVHPS